MRIDTVEAWLLQRRLERPLGVSRGDQWNRYTALVRLRTADGLEGWGEGVTDARLWPAFLAIVTQAWGPLLQRSDPWDGERLWREAAEAMVYWEQKGVAMTALSAVDTALWDLRGKALGVPVCHLLGGTPRPIRAYASDLFWDEPAALAERARTYVEAGYGAVKMHVGRGPAADAARVHAVREAIGPEIGLAVDINCGYDRPTALDLALRLEHEHLLWYEEPLAPHDLTGCTLLRQRTRVPVATGENEYTLHGFAALLEHGAADYLMPDVARAGGLTEYRKICALAEAAHVPVTPHNFGGPVAAAATLHAMAAFPITTWLEWDVTGTPILDQIVQEPFTLRDGAVSVPAGPGLGVSIDLAALQRFTVQHTQTE